MRTLTSTAQRFGPSLSSPLLPGSPLHLRLTRLARLLAGGRVYHSSGSTPERHVVALLRGLPPLPVTRRAELPELLAVISGLGGAALGVTYLYGEARRHRYLLWVDADGSLRIRNGRGEIRPLSLPDFEEAFFGYGFTDLLVQPLLPQMTVPAGQGVAPAPAGPLPVVPAPAATSLRLAVRSARVSLERA